MNFQKMIFIAMALMLANNVFAHDDSTNSGDLILTPSDDGVELCIENYQHLLDLTVKNNGADAKTVTLYSNSDEFLPSFNPSIISLAAGEEKHSTVKINVNEFFNRGNHSILVIAKTDNNELFQENYEFELSDCLGQRNSFELDVDKTSISMDKLDEKKIHFTIENNLDEIQQISFSAVSDLAVREEQFHFTLGAFDSQESFIEIETRQNDNAKTHFIDLIAWSEFGEKKESIEVKIRKDPNVSFKILQDETITQTVSATKILFYEIELTNNGDEEDTISFSTDLEEETINITILENEISLDESETKIIKVIVTPSFDTPLGEQEMQLTMRADESDFEEEITFNFTVIAPEIITQPQVLKIVSSPQEINIDAGKEKIINIKIENDSGIKATNIYTRVRGIDSTQFSFIEDSLTELNAGDNASLNLLLVVSNNAVTKEYDLTVEIITENSVNTVPFTLNISSKTGSLEEENALIPGFSGFVGFADGIGSEIALLTIILIIAVGIILWFLLTSSDNKKVVTKYYH